MRETPDDLYLSYYTERKEISEIRAKVCADLGFLLEQGGFKGLLEELIKVIDEIDKRKIVDERRIVEIVDYVERFSQTEGVVQKELQTLKRISDALTQLNPENPEEFEAGVMALLEELGGDPQTPHPNDGSFDYLIRNF